MKSSTRHNMSRADYRRVTFEARVPGHKYSCHRRSHKTGLFVDRADAIGHKPTYDPRDRGAVRAAERAELRPSREWRTE